MLVGGAAASAVMVATFATGKVLEANELKKATVDNEAIIDFIQSEIASHKALIARKKDSIRQIEKEITAEQNRIKELSAMMERVKVTQNNENGGKVNG